MTTLRERTTFLGSLFFILFFPITGFAVDPPALLRFIENKNQWPREVLFATDVQSGRMVLTKDRFRFYFYGQRDEHPGKGKGHVNLASVNVHDDGSVHRTPKDFHVYDVTFPGSRKDVQMIASGLHTTRYNYFLGADRQKWASGARAFSEVLYKEIYCDIDLGVYSQGAYVKYDWRVAPGANPAAIAMLYDGVDKVELKGEDLSIRTTVNEVTELKPFAYQIIDGKQTIVACNFQLQGKMVTYDFPEGFDACYELVIDPILIFSAYSGSFLDNWGNTAAFDSAGNTYSGGMVNNPFFFQGFPTTPGTYQTQSAGGTWDVGIMKYDSSGSNLLYATYLGGSRTETPQSLVVNSKGELLVLGATGSNNFPVTNGSAFRGGNPIDPLNGVYYSNGTDLFVAKLSADGSQLLGGTYLGGTGNDGVNFVSGNMDTPNYVESPLAKNYGDQLRGDIITGENDEVYVASNTRSSNFTGATNFFGGSHDAVIVKLTADLSTISTARYVGGFNTDAAYSVKLANGKVYVAGGTDSNNFFLPGTSGLRTTKTGIGNIDGWVASFSPNDLSIINGTFLGTAQYDQAYFIDLNESGDVYVFGQTRGSYPVTPTQVYRNTNAGQFIHKFSGDLMTTHFSTVVGSVGTSSVNPNISPTAFLVSECNNLYLSGWGGRINSPEDEVFYLGNVVEVTRNYVGGNTRSMPLSQDAHQKTTQGNDFYMMVLSADATQFLYGTYLGGTNSAVHVDGGTSRFDKQGIVYHAVCAGCGGNSDFPSVNVPAAHQQNRSTNCNNAVFKFDLALLKARIETNSVMLDRPGLKQVCIPDKLAFQNNSTGGKIFHWDFGDGTLVTKNDKDTVQHRYLNPGEYVVKLVAIDVGTCKVIDSTFTVVKAIRIEAMVQDDDNVCEGSAYKLSASGGVSYQWKTASGVMFSALANPTVTPLDTTKYFVTIADHNGCVLNDSVQLNMVPGIAPKFEADRISDCQTRPSIHVESLTDSLWADDVLFFDFGDGTTSDLPTTDHKYATDGIYAVRLTSSRFGCVYEQVEQIPVFTIAVPNVITPGGTKDLNDTFFIQYGAAGVTPAQFDLKVSLIIYNRWGTVLFETDDYKYDWAGEGLAAGVYYYEVKVQKHSSCKGWLHIVK